VLAEGKPTTGAVSRQDLLASLAKGGKQEDPGLADACRPSGKRPVNPR
jgi:hypothetical protein